MLSFFCIWDFLSLSRQECLLNPLNSHTSYFYSPLSSSISNFFTPCRRLVILERAASHWRAFEKDPEGISQPPFPQNQPLRRPTGVCMGTSLCSVQKVLNTFHCGTKKTCVMLSSWEQSIHRGPMPPKWPSRIHRRWDSYLTSSVWSWGNYSWSLFGICAAEAGRKQRAKEAT